ncbi:helix-turn-helix domain-containing protein [Bacillus toyonensis]|uniref:helix-turn-helix domain-containing protein n=1 Tax=Bacillus toyonensis TaxID=155322 RepID=UPI000BF5C141|nr:helix-turn-helix domain-containing protein [Bacillus toyonensis]PGF05187.1 transcriptional regulator [Bacillus toyonensis]
MVKVLETDELVEVEITRDQQIAKALELHKSNMKVKDIIKETGIPESTLYRIFRANNLRKQPRKNKIDVEKLEEALDMFVNRDELGLTVKQISEKTGISKQTIYVEAKAREVDFEFVGKGYTKESLEKAVEMYQRPIKEKITLKKIYEETGVSRSVLYKELESRGIEIRHGNRLSYTEESLETSVHLYKNRHELGIGVSDIIERTGICINALHRELRKRKLIKGNTNRKYPIRLVNQAIRLILNKENNYSVAQVSEQTGIKESTLFAELRDRGIRLRERKAM